MRTLLVLALLAGGCAMTGPPLDYGLYDDCRRFVAYHNPKDARSLACAQAMDAIDSRLAQRIARPAQDRDQPQAQERLPADPIERSRLVAMETPTTQLRIQYLRCQDVIAKLGASDPQTEPCLQFVVEMDEARERVEARAQGQARAQAAAQARAEAQAQAEAAQAERRRRIARAILEGLRDTAHSVAHPPGSPTHTVNCNSTTLMPGQTNTTCYEQ